MKKILLLAAICFSMQASAQEEVYSSSGRSVSARKKQGKKEGFDKSKLILGGGIGLIVGNETNIGLSPVIGYRITDHFSAGIGLSFQYYSVKNFWEIYNPSTSQYEYKPLKAFAYSGSIWARYLVYRNLFVQTEIEYNAMRFKQYESDFMNNNIKSSSVQLSAPALLVGAGYRFPIGENSSVVIMILYDVIQDKYSPYGNQLFTRFGFNIGF